MLKQSFKFVLISIITASVISSCKKKDKMVWGKDPNTTEVVSVDRFSNTAGHLMVRTASNGLPAANVAIDFDKAPFITKGLTPSGAKVEYYNFDVQPTTPAPIWVFFKEGATSPVSGQLNVIDVIPGEAGYNDFWQVYKVTVPANYVANTITSYSEIVAKGYAISKQSAIVNCPVVPKGSTATKRFLSSESAATTIGWYKGKVVHYFNFSEKSLSATSSGLVPLSPIYVTFKINPDQPNGGPASGFVTETDGVQTHNVIATVPADAPYSPLWSVSVYNNTAFGSVSNLQTASAAPILGTNVATVNCPVVKIY